MVAINIQSQFPEVKAVAFTCDADVRQYLAALLQLDLLYAIEDDFDTIYWGRQVSLQLLLIMKENGAQLRAYCDKAGVDPYEFYPETNN